MRLTLFQAVLAAVLVVVEALSAEAVAVEPLVVVEEAAVEVLGPVRRAVPGSLLYVMGFRCSRVESASWVEDTLAYISH